MEEFSIGRAWNHGYRFVAEGTVVHFLILLLIGILAPIGVQYAIIGAPMNGASPMAGPAMMNVVGVPSILLTVALSHVLQAGSYFSSLRFGYTNGQNPAGAIAWGLAAGLVATLIVAIGYVVAIFGGQATMAPSTFVLAIIMMMLPLFVVYSLFFLGVAIMMAGTLIVSLVFLFIYGLAMGYPEAAAAAFGGSGMITVIILLMCVLLFWLAARSSCVLPLMAERENLNAFGAIAESWRLTADDQMAIFRYVSLVGLGVGLVLFGISFVIGMTSAGSMQGGLVIGTNGQMILGILFGIPVAFLSVMLPAGIYRSLVGDEAPVEVFE